MQQLADLRGCTVCGIGSRQRIICAVLRKDHSYLVLSLRPSIVRTEQNNRVGILGLLIIDKRCFSQCSVSPMTCVIHDALTAKRLLRCTFQVQWHDDLVSPIATAAT